MPKITATKLKKKKHVELDPSRCCIYNNRPIDQQRVQRGLNEYLKELTREGIQEMINTTPFVYILPETTKTADFKRKSRTTWSKNPKAKILRSKRNSRKYSGLGSKTGMAYGVEKASNDKKKDSVLEVPAIATRVGDELQMSTTVAIASTSSLDDSELNVTNAADVKGTIGVSRKRKLNLESDVSDSSSKKAKPDVGTEVQPIKTGTEDGSVRKRLRQKRGRSSKTLKKLEDQKKPGKKSEDEEQL